MVDIENWKDSGDFRRQLQRDRESRVPIVDENLMYVAQVKLYLRMEPRIGAGVLQSFKNRDLCF